MNLALHNKLLKLLTTSEAIKSLNYGKRLDVSKKALALPEKGKQHIVIILQQEQTVLPEINKKLEAQTTEIKLLHKKLGEALKAVRGIVAELQKNHKTA